MGGELAQLPVDGDEVTGPHRLEHPPLLPPRRMARDVEPGLDAGVQYSRPGGEHRVDERAHRALVARHRTGAEEHRVPALDAQALALGLEELGQRGPRLSLGARCKDAQVVGQQPLRFLHRAEQTLGELEASRPPGRLHVPLQAPPGEDQPPPGAMADLDDVLHPVQVRGEESDQHAAAGLGDETVQSLGNDALRRGLTLHLGVGGVAEEAQRLAVRERLEPSDVGGPRVERGLVELEVPGVHHRSLGCPEQEAHRVGDGVGHPERLDLEDRRGVERLAGEDLPEVGPDVHLVEPLGHQRQGEAGAVDRDHALAQQERQRADVVLVRVGEEHRPELGGAVPEVAEVRDDELDPGQLGRGKEQTGVDEEELVPALEHHRVQANLAESAEGDDAQHGGARL